MRMPGPPPRPVRTSPVAEVAVALLHGARLAAPLAERTGLRVEATEPDDHLEVARRLADELAAENPGGDEVAPLVVGLAAVPWPLLADLHAEGSASLPAYAGVVSWHEVVPLLDALAHAVAPAARAGAHVLFTAPDPGQGLEPGDLVFLREVAERVSDRAGLTNRSIAWQGSTRSPTVVEALEALVAAHGALDVVECPVAPGTQGDPELSAAAERLGVRATALDLGRSTQLDVLTHVVSLVADTEAPS